MRRHLPFAVLGAGALAVYLVVQYRWFPHLSKNNDEPVYLFQAAMLQDGHLTLPASEVGLSFRPWMSGVVGDRVVLAFPPGWPAVLALGTLVAPFKVVGALAAALALLGVYVLAVEITRSRTAAVAASAFVGLSPLMVVLGGTVLSYPFAMGVGALVGGLGLRAVRTGRRGLLLGVGAAAGLLASMRPLDAVVVSGIVGSYLVWSWRRRPGEVARAAAWAVVGAGPFVAAILAVNAHLTGSPFRFPLEVNGGDNRLGFGTRQISAGARVFDVTPAMMERVTGRLLGELPNWTLGGLVVIPLVAWGAARVWRRRRPDLFLLLALGVAFPAAYFFYWGSRFVSVGRHDYGPFYYLPVLVPVGVAVGEGLAGLARRSRVVAVLVAAAAVGSLAPSLAPKYERAERHNRGVAREVDLVDALPRRALVVLPGSNDGPWMLHVRGYFANPPDLRSERRLYAADTGGGNIDLLDRFPDRPVYQLFGVLPSDRVFGDPEPRVARLTRVAGVALGIRASFTNATDNPTVISYVGLPGGFVRCVLDEASTPGRTYTSEWTVTADGPLPPPGCRPLPPVHLDGRPINANLVVGFSASATTDLDGVNRWEYLYALRTATGGKVEVLDPGVPRRTSAGDLGEPRADYPGRVDEVLDVTVKPVSP